MPHWVALVAVVAFGWLVLAVLGGTVVGRVLALLERRLTRPARTSQRPP